MKVFHLEARAEVGNISFDTSDLPDKLGLVSTVQFLDWLEPLAEFLKKNGKTSVIGGQVLGCEQNSALKIKDSVNAFLYLGTGRFHPVGVAKKTKLPVWTLHPETMKLSKVDNNEIEKILKKRKGQYIKFLSSKNIGVLITKKSGQCEVQSSLHNVLKIDDEFPDKKFYFFISDTLDFNELENFPFIECWLNTMCPRVEEDLSVLNLEDLREFEK